MGRTVFPTKPIKAGHRQVGADTKTPQCHFCPDWATRRIVLFHGMRPLHLCRLHADELRTRLEEETR